ncbi:MAG: 3-dehydroquinate synthase [Gammaproteobacteria bacterium]
MQTVTVDLGTRSYPIYIGEQLLSDPTLVAPHLGKGRVVIITNDVVAPLYLEKVKPLFASVGCEQIVLPDGEAHKNLDSVSHIYDHLLQGKFDRQTILVALGGGVIGDITGFAAATYQRGINYIQIPTTLLAQVDSSVGGKTGVNHTLGKNMIGAFHQPRCVIADITTLATLPVREIGAGLAEVLKYGLINDKQFFDWLAEHGEAICRLDRDPLVEALRKCCESKADIVARDEQESGVRALLNLGHTFGHAIETATGYGTWLHGETVAMGMVMAADLSARMGWLQWDDAWRIRQVLENGYKLPVIPPASISVSRYLELMASDKKVAAGKIRFVLLQAIGAAELTADVAPDLLEQTLNAGAGLCRPQ